jgi:phosphotransferase system HPr (HPr) family protein
VRTVRLPDGVDLHARPAGKLVRAAAAYDASVTLIAGERRADAKSILQVLALGATGGSDVVLETSGADASEALDVISGLLASLA